MVKQCNKVIFQYEKDSPLLLEFHVDKQATKELKKQAKGFNKRIENGKLLAIEVEQYNTKYKYVIERVWSYEVNEGILRIKFDGKAYENGRSYIDTALESFTSKCENCRCTFYQHPQANTANICGSLGMFFAGCLTMAGGVVLRFTNYPEIGGGLILSAVVCALITGIVKLCETISEKKQKDLDVSTCTAAGTVFSDIFSFGVSANTNNKT